MNEEIFKKKIVESIIYSLKRNKIKNYNVGNWVVNDFSSIFKLELVFDEKICHYHIKIPRTKIEKDTIYKISKEDFIMGKNEFKSLLYLKKKWPNNYKVKFIKPIIYLQKYNAVVTETFIGSDFFLKLRKYDLLYKLKILSLNSNFNYKLKYISKSISKFHRNAKPSNSKQKKFNYKPLINKIIKKIIILKKKNISRIDLVKLFKRLYSLKHKNIKTNYCYTLKGLDIRNILMNKKNLIYLLDPGKLKLEPEMAGIARYLVTIELIYWGKILFFFNFTLANDFKKSIMNGLGSLNLEEKELLNIFLIKEYLKHWNQAYHNIDLKKWPNFFKNFNRKYYVDRFFLTRIKKLFKIYE